MSYWAITNGAYAFDGGTIWLGLIDPEGGQHSVVLGQHRLPQRDDARLRGRLYWDDGLVDVRGSQETEILDLLRKAHVKPSDRGEPAGGPADHVASKENRLVLGADIEDYLDATDASPEAALAHLVREVLSFVESDAYGALG